MSVSQTMQSYFVPVFRTNEQRLAGRDPSIIGRLHGSGAINGDASGGTVDFLWSFAGFQDMFGQSALFSVQFFCWESSANQTAGWIRVESGEISSYNPAYLTGITSLVTGDYTAFGAISRGGSIRMFGDFLFRYGGAGNGVRIQLAPNTNGENYSAYWAGFVHEEKYL